MTLKELRDKALKLANIIPPVNAYNSIKQVASPQYQQQVRQMPQQIQQVYQPVKEKVQNYFAQPSVKQDFKSVISPTQPLDIIKGFFGRLNSQELGSQSFKGPEFGPKPDISKKYVPQNESQKLGADIHDFGADYTNYQNMGINTMIDDLFTGAKALPQYQYAKTTVNEFASKNYQKIINNLDKSKLTFEDLQAITTNTAPKGKVETYKSLKQSLTPEEWSTYVRELNKSKGNKNIKLKSKVADYFRDLITKTQSNIKTKLSPSELKLLESGEQTPTQYVDDILNKVPSKKQPYDFAKDMDRINRLKSLMTYEDDLAKLGYTNKERASTSVNTARKILNNELPGKWNFNKQYIDESVTKNILHEESITNAKGKFRSIVAPLKNLAPDLQDAILKHDIKLKTAKVAGVKISNFLESKLPSDLEWKLVQFSQSPDSATMKSLGLNENDIEKGSDLIKKHKAFNDELFKRANESGMDTNYLKNHIYQKWQEGPEKIEQIVRSLSKRPGFSHSRKIRNFEEGMKIGLTPKFTTFRQLDANAEYAFQKAIANKDLADTLFNGKHILPSNAAPADWVQISTPLFPRAKVKIGLNETVEVPYSAPRYIAEFVDNYFGVRSNSPASQALQITSNISKKMQDVVLSGGVNTVNSFTLGNVIQDFTAAVGDLMTGHPIRAYKTAENTVMALLRGFIPDMTGKYEIAHFKTIEEMAENGIQYSGTLDWLNIKKNVVSPEKQGVIDKMFNAPTFQKFLNQRRIGLYEIYRDDMIKRGVPKKKAITKAVELVKNYEGVVWQLGKNKDFDNIISTGFLAPKYREALVNSFGNLAPAFSTKFKDPAFDLTRRLGIGMVTTLFLYNELNKKLNNGKNMWENPAGKELELVIPAGTKDNSNRYFSIPFMPGKTAIFRRIFGMATGFIKGDKQEAWKNFAGLFSIPVSKGIELATNRDYFGRDLIKDDTENYGSKPSQYAIWAGKSFLPGPIREGITYAQDVNAYNKKKALGKNADKPNPWISLARSSELPLKEGDFPSTYFANRDAVLKAYSQDEEAIASFNMLHPETEEFKIKEPKTEQERLMFAAVRAYQPRVFEMEKEIAIRQSQEDGSPLDPLYSVEPRIAQIYLMSLTMIPGSQDKKDLYDQYPEMGLLAEQRGDYFDMVITDSTSDRPVASDYVQEQMDEKNWKDPEVRAYLDANRKYQNKQRAALGLNPLADYEWSDYKKKITIKKADSGSQTKITKDKLLSLGKLKLKPYKSSKGKGKLDLKEPKNLLTMAKLLERQTKIKAPKKAVVKYTKYV